MQFGRFLGEAFVYYATEEQEWNRCHAVTAIPGNGTKVSCDSVSFVLSFVTSLDVAMLCSVQHVQH